MQSFLEQAASVLWQNYGEGISDLKLVFPSKRARLFFGEALSKHIRKPLWQPEYLSIDDLMWSLSRMQKVDNLRLVAELYKIYNQYHPEPFDKFYAWGVMLLQDFDTIDKYMVDAPSLFSNISDLKDVEAQFEADTPELELVREFWRNFAENRVQSHEQREFLRVWHSLSEVYSKFKIRLSELGIAYPGMAYRYVAENIAGLYSEPHTYCFLGFNALNECEQKLFKFLHEKGDALFLWDYSDYYVNDPKQEAGRFIRRNLSKFPQSFPLGNGYNKGLKISVIASPTDILQCKALTRELEQIFRKQGFVDKETAVVLTDENLLQTVLTSIPDCVEKLNITMGYPLVNTLVYNLIERLLQLQLRYAEKGFYHKDVIGLLNHPYINELNHDAAKELILSLSEQQKIYIEHSSLEGFESLFQTVRSVGELQEYLLRVLSSISVTDEAERREHTYTAISTISRLSATITNCDIELTTVIYMSLLKQALAQVRIPFTGEPLGGLQVLGILETRNVDFKNVIMLSVNEDNFPGNRAGQSYVPYNLRQAYGLPTVIDAEAMYAYYFYRLMQRAETLAMLYTSAADDKTTGEQSRYIYQLEYESEFEVKRRDISLTVVQSKPAAIEVEKSSDIVEKLRQKRYSPSALNRYITCPIKFYFNDIAHIEIPDTLDEEFTKLNLGNTLHRAMELLYLPLVGVANPQNRIKQIPDDEIERVVNAALKEEAEELSMDTGAHMDLRRKMILRYVKQNLRYDSQRTENYVIKGLEYKFNFRLFDVEFIGSADRIDLLGDGSIGLIDYKTGGDKLAFSSLESLFDPMKTDRNSAALQILIYGLILRESERIDVQPELYVSKLMNKSDFSPMITMKSNPVCLSDDEFYVELKERLNDLMVEILDPKVPFTQNKIGSNCDYCDFNAICNN